MIARKAPPGRSGLDLAEAGCTLLRSAPARDILIYYAGSVPFVMGALLFILRMSRDAFAAHDAGWAAARVAVLFTGMKCAHAVFSARLRARVSGTADAPWRAGRILRMAALQSAIQPFGFFVLPLALLAVVPFGWVHGFLNNVTVLGDGREGAHAVLGKAWRQARLWPGQHHVLLWLSSPWLLGIGFFAAFLITAMAAYTSGLSDVAPTIGPWLTVALLMIIGFATLPVSPAGFLLAGNLSIMLVLVPMALRAWTGIETVFAMHPMGMIFNTTFPLMVFGFCFLCMDPVMKAAYVIRCFDGDSISSGADLLGRLASVTESK